jgi:SOS response regulatory protein OraA/RecX
LELRQEDEVLAEKEISFPLQHLPTTIFSSVEEAQEWLVQKERKMAKNQALRCLARQSLASTILLQKLQAKGYSPAICSEVVQSCQSYLSDEEYWPRLVERELARGFGPRWIFWKWKSKGLPDHLVERLATSEKQKEGIRKIRAKLKDRKKAFRILLQRGYDAHIIAEMIALFCP